MIPFAACRPYLPLLVTEWQVKNPEARWREIEGSMVFADVSGFTSMSERLARHGRVGAEEVTAVISETFDRLLAEASAYGGSLLKFGGDAQLVFFTDADHPARAASAAIGMREELRRFGSFTTSAGNVTLRVSVGAHSGTFHFFLVGGSHRELIVAGPSASATVAMESAASTGQILVSPSLAEHLPEANRGRKQGPGILLRGDRPRTPAAVGSVDLSGETADLDLTSFVPRALRPIVLDGGAGAEHRPVTVAFVRFDGFDAFIAASGAAAASLALDELVGVAQAAADRHQICFLGSDIADDGGKLILSAGAPDVTGNDEERMLLALREIASSDLQLRIHVGVNRGHVFAGEVGPDYRRTYTVMGDAVNLAARLMARSEPGQILATGQVLEGSRTLFEVTGLAPFAVKGKRQPVQAYSVGNPTGSRSGGSQAELPLIGRDRELSEMMSAWSAARGGQGHVIEISAEAGMGKSRLLQEFLAQAEPPRILRSESRLYQSATPYFPFKGVLRQALGLDALDAAAAADRLAVVVAEQARHLEPWLALIGVPLGLDIEESEEVTLLEDQFRRSRLEEAVGDLLGEVLTDPVIILIEDTHWMDDASGDLLKTLAGSVAARPWLICLTRRPGDGGLVATGEDAVIPIELQPLGESEAGGLIVAAAGDLALLPQQIRSLARRAHGNPLFLIELVRALQLGEDVESLPQSVEGLIHARVDRLPRRDRTALRHLSVLGAGFDVQHAGTVLSDWGSEHPSEVLHRLSDFLSMDADGWCEFEHALIRDVAYTGLPYRSRRQLHARVAESILATPAESEERTALLSVHFFHAGRWEEAWTYSRAAGDGAKRDHANVEAATFYDRALQAARRLEEVTRDELAAVTEALGEVHDLSGLYAEAGGDFRSARKLAGNPLDEARLRLKEAWIEDKRGRYSQALRWLTLGRRALDSVRNRDAEAMRAQLSVWRSAMNFAQGRFEKAIDWAEQAMDEAERAEDRDALAHSLYLHDAASVYLGRSIDEGNSRRALEIYEDLGDLSGQAIVANNLAGFAYYEGRWSDAVELYEQSRDARLRSGNPVEAVRAGAGIGEILCDQGDLERARPVLEEALSVWRAAGYPFGVAFVVSQLGRVASRAGGFAEADRLYREARTVYSELKARSDILETETRLAENLVYQGRAVDAAEQLARAGSTADDLGGEPVQVTRLHLLRGYASAQSGDLTTARLRFEESLQGARRRDATYEIALALEALCRLGRLEGRRDWREELEECWSIFDRLGVVSLPAVPLMRSDALAASER